MWRSTVKTSRKKFGMIENDGKKTGRKKQAKHKYHSLNSNSQTKPNQIMKRPSEYPSRTNLSLFLSFTKKWRRVKNDSVFALVFIVATVLFNFLSSSSQLRKSSRRSKERIFFHGIRIKRRAVRRSENDSPQHNFLSAVKHPRIVQIGTSLFFKESTLLLDKNSTKQNRVVKEYPPEFSDITQYYPIADSVDDSRVQTSMERHTFPRRGDNSESKDDCVPIANWQMNLFPTCNHLHTVDFRKELASDSLTLLSDKGFWRHAWKLRSHSGAGSSRDNAMVLKTIIWKIHSLN